MSQKHEPTEPSLFPPDIEIEQPASFRTHDRRGSDSYEATELARIRTRYSNASTSRRPATVATAQRPTTALARVQNAILKFWRNQISVIVAHDACRDHLGMSLAHLVSPSLCWSSIWLQ
jgi:hypothetical protein